MSVKKRTTGGGSLGRTKASAGRARRESGSRPGMRLRRLTLKNWRNFKDADFDVQDRLFIVGPNASGKSNLLDSLRFLQQIVSEGGGFQKAVKDRGGMENLRCLAARNHKHGQVMIGIVLEGEDKVRWTYELAFTFEGTDRRRPILESEKVWKNKKQLLDRPTEADKSDPKLMTQTFLEQMNSNQGFRPVAEFLETIQYLHLVPHLIRGMPGSRMNGVGGEFGDDPYGADFFARIVRMPAASREKRLQRICDALKIAVPQLASLELARDTVGKWHLQARYRHWRSTKARQNERDFSDGTLRLIGLLWSLMELDGMKKEGKRLLLLEEPELSLPTSVIRQLPGIFFRMCLPSNAQILVTTHSYDLLEDEGLGLDEVLVLKPGGEGTVAAMAKGIPQVNELLAAGLSLAEIVEPKTRPPEVEDFARELSRA